jgi:WD40 repeat protein
VKDLQEIARYYGNLYLARLTRDHTKLFVRDTLGISVYDYTTNKLIKHIDIYSPSIYLKLQISDDGEWALIDGKWLFHPGTDNTAKDLRNIIDLAGLDHDPGWVNVALSPAGTKIAIYQIDCNNGSCVSKFFILDPLTSQFIYTWKGAYTDMHGASPFFSPEGSFITTIVDSNIVIWNLADGSIVRRFPFGGDASDFVISDDLSLMAIRATNSINNPVTIWSLKTGEKVQSILTGYQTGDYCNEIIKNNSLIFSSQADKIAAIDCSGNVRVWSIADGNLLTENHYDIGVPSIIFNDGGNIKLLTSPYSFNNLTLQTFREGYYFHPYSFKFQDNQNVAINYYDSECIIPLYSGNLKCVANVILGTDNSYYSYQIDNNKIRLFTPSTSNNILLPLYEIPSERPFLGVDSNLEIFGFDPKHALLFYEIMLGQYYFQVNIVDLKTNEKLNTWDKYTIVSYQFSEDNKIAALLLQPFWNYSQPSRLVLFNLELKRIIFEEQFPWQVTPSFALSNTGERRQLAFRNVSSGISSQFVLLNIDQPNARKKINVDCSGSTLGKLVFSPDDTFIIATCSDGSIHFLNSTDGTEFHRISGYPSVGGLAFSPDGKKMSIFFGEGVINVLAIPPFSAINLSETQVNPPGMNAPGSFEYPIDGQVLSYEGDYMFKVTPVEGANGYLWGFFQNGVMVWENMRDEGELSGNEYVIVEGSFAHSKFVSGNLEVWVRASVNGQWTEPTIITIYLEP